MPPLPKDFSTTGRARAALVLWTLCAALVLWGACAPVGNTANAIPPAVGSALLPVNATLAPISAATSPAVNATSPQAEHQATGNATIPEKTGLSRTSTVNATLPTGNATFSSTNATFPLEGFHLVNGTLLHSPGAAWPGTQPVAPPPGKVFVMDPVWQPLIVRLSLEGFPLDRMAGLFASLGPGSYSSAFMATKITELYGISGIGIRPEEDPAVMIPQNFVQPLSDITMGSCRAFVKKHAKELEDIRQKYGVPANVLVAIMLVETGFGVNLGDNSAFRALASMAVTNTPAMLAAGGNKAQVSRMREATLRAALREKSEWAYKELKALILFAEKSGRQACLIPGSMYGAVGLCQFMPSNIEPYGVDGDGDGAVDLFTAVDALYSVANYLEAHGWRGAKTDQQKFAVILHYNQDGFYAGRVLGVANQRALAFAGKGKIGDGRNPLGGVYGMPGRVLDPSLRRRRVFVPEHARVKKLGEYEELLK